VLGKAHGDVLEMSAGTGKNFHHYSSVRRLIASDLSGVFIEDLSGSRSPPSKETLHRRDTKFPKPHFVFFPKTPLHRRATR